MRLFPIENKKRNAEETYKVAAAETSHTMLGFEVHNLQGMGARERQEDAFAFVNSLDVIEIQKNGMMFIVADGMGGMEDGGLASRIAVESITSDFLQMDREEDLAAQLEESIYRAGHLVYQKLRGNGGSTVVAGILFREQLYFASVGDSYLYLARDGKIFRLNREHNLLNQAYIDGIRDGIMKQDTAMDEREAGMVTQYLGREDMGEVDMFRKPLPLCEGDILLACSDGVAGVLSEDTIGACLKKENPKDICRVLEREIVAQKRQYQDNFTALVVRCVF